MKHPARQTIRAFFEAVEASCGNRSCWQPAADVYRGSDGWLIKFDLAGVRGEDITIIVDGPNLTIRGMRHDLAVLENQQAFSMEIAYNSFERTVKLPVDVESAELRHEYHDGMFLILVKDRS